MKINLPSNHCVVSLLRLFATIGVLSASCHATTLSLEQAQQLAVQRDLRQQMSMMQEQALVADSSAAATQPDPVLSLGLANLPTDSWQFNQEAMTQLKVGLSQQFARGDSLELNRRQLLNQAAKHPWLRQDRQAKLKVMVAKQWLDAFTAELRIQIITSSRPFFVQLSDIAQASYAAAQGRTRQQDIIQAQVEIARLDDKLSALLTERDSKLANLTEWLLSPDTPAIGDFSISTHRPTIALPSAPIQQLLQQQNKTQLAQVLQQHPAMLAAQQQIYAQLDGVELAKQKYQPQWGVNASYAYRDDAPNGSSRADFFSVGVSVDLPFFSHQRQDKALESARLQAEASKTEQHLLLRNLLAQAINNWQSAQHTAARITHFEQLILPQMAQHTESTLNAYTADAGDFGDVMRAKIAELNTQLELIKLQNELAQYQVQLQYYFPSTADATAHMPITGDSQ